METTKLNAFRQAYRNSKDKEEVLLTLILQNQTTIKQIQKITETIAREMFLITSTLQEQTKLLKEIKK